MEEFFDNIDESKIAKGLVETDKTNVSNVARKALRTAITDALELKESDERNVTVEMRLNLAGNKYTESVAFPTTKETFIQAINNLTNMSIFCGKLGYIEDAKPGDCYDSVDELFESKTMKAGSSYIAVPETQMLDIKGVLDLIDTKRVAIQKSRPLTQALKEFIEKLNILLTYSSNAIEGNTFTMEETSQVIESVMNSEGPSSGIHSGEVELEQDRKRLKIPGHPESEHLEAVNHYKVLCLARELVQTNAKITEDLLLRMHGELMKSLLEKPGRYRDINVKVTGSPTKFPDHQEVPNLMRDFVSWLAHGPPEDRHYILWTVEAHTRLVNIHPWADGNGRMSRLLLNMLLLQKGYPIAAVNPTIKRFYSEGVQNFREGNHKLLERIFLEAINRTADLYMEHFKLVD